MYSIVFGCPLECLSLGINRLIYCCISMSWFISLSVSVFCFCYIPLTCYMVAFHVLCFHQLFSFPFLFSVLSDPPFLFICYLLSSLYITIPLVVFLFVYACFCFCFLYYCSRGRLFFYCPYLVPFVFLLVIFLVYSRYLSIFLCFSFVSLKPSFALPLPVSPSLCFSVSALLVHNYIIMSFIGSWFWPLVFLFLTRFEIRGAFRSIANRV